jgi:hypothetical protein
MSIVAALQFPFDRPMGQELLRTLAIMYRTERDAFAFVEQHGIDTLSLTQGVSPLNLWHEVLQKAAVEGVTRRIVKAALDAHPNNPRADFLRALLVDAPAAVSAEPLDRNGPAFADDVTEPEALLFFDDLTLPIGQVAGLVTTLNKMIEVAPSVCLLQVDNGAGEYFGTGFRIGAEHVLTNEHVLVPKGRQALRIRVEFGFEDRGGGPALASVALSGELASVRVDAADDWGVVRVPGMDAAWPILDLGAASVPAKGDATYILQHPGGHRKRLGFVRNTITDVTEQVIRYLTDTEPGSSGAPVFDDAGHVIALHHRGGRPTEVAGKPPVSKNEGIRISRVLSGLRTRGIVP